MNIGQRWKAVKRRGLPWFFLFPALAFIACFMYVPLLRQVWISFTDTKLVNPNSGNFVGLKNYTALFTGGDIFQVLGTTVLYTVMVLVMSVSLGLVSALAINRPFHGQAVVRGILLSGWAVPGVATSLIWMWMYNEKSGVFNTILRHLGMSGVGWLTDPHVALISVSLTTVWQVAPFAMLVLLAALQSVPQDVEEASKIDGADTLNVFRYVTFPAIKPTLSLVCLLVAVWTIRRFELIYLLTGGGPIKSTTTIVVALRNVAFENMDLGGAAAYGVIGLILALAVGLIQIVVEGKSRGGAGDED